MWGLFSTNKLSAMITQHFMLSKVLKTIYSFIHINTLQHLVESELYFVVIVTLLLFSFVFLFDFIGGLIYTL